MSRHFRHLLEAKWLEGKFVCVGLDPDIDKLPISLRIFDEDDRVHHRGKSQGELIIDFLLAVVAATTTVAACYKLNAWFFLSMGKDGWKHLRELIREIHQMAPAIPVILDMKGGDIASSNAAYADAVFHFLEADAITLHPYLGGDTFASQFLSRPEKGCIVLCKTSNPGSGEFQDLRVDTTEWGLGEPDEHGFRHVPLYHAVAHRVATAWNEHGNCGLVTGATYPSAIREVRKLVGDTMFLLVPGIGRQGGDLVQAVQAARNSARSAFVINSSSGITHASSQDDYADAARLAAEKLHREINEVP